MSGATALALNAVLIGIGATAFMDLFALIRARLFGVPSLDYALVGRWIGHVARGRFSHSSIAAAPAIAGERLIGWMIHYATGILFAGALLVVCGTEWTEQPTLVPALTVGVATLPAPFMIMWPAMGLGVAASRTPNPNQARLRSLIGHLAFGFGLFLAALLVALVR